MTPESRAEALCKKLGMTKYPEDCAYIAAQIAEAEREAVGLPAAEWFRRGYAAAREQAAGVIDSLWEENKNCDPEAGLLLGKSITAIRAIEPK